MTLPGANSAHPRSPPRDRVDDILDEEGAAAEYLDSEQG